MSGSNSGFGGAVGIQLLEVCAYAAMNGRCPVSSVLLLKMWIQLPVMVSIM
jgi:hypothetical protein